MSFLPTTTEDFQGRVVQPLGSKTSKIAIVGEAPGLEEARSGQPFVGPSGNLLTQVCLSAGISRSDCYITNVVKERPPNNDISKFITFTTRGVSATEEYKRYEDELYLELKDVKANVLVLAGAVPLWALCRRTGITKWRGSILQSITGHKAIPIIHPAAALRQYIWRYFILHDLKRVKEQSTFPELRLPTRKLISGPTFAEVMSFLSEVSSSTLVAWDIEVVRNELYCMSFALSPTYALCIPFYSYPDGDTFLAEEELQIMQEVKAILESKKIKKIGQNIIFDSSFVFRKYGIVVENVEDTMVAWAIAYPDFPKGLDLISSFMTEEPYYKDDGKKYIKLGSSDESFWLYNNKDAAVTYESFPKIYSILETQKNIKCYERQRDLIYPLNFIQACGIRVDKPALDKAKEEVSKQLEELEEKFRELCGMDINPASSKQLIHYFYTIKGYKPYVNRKTGNQSVDVMALKRLSRKGSKEAECLLRIRKLAKIKSTYLEVTLDPDNRLRCSMNPVGTKQGRISSSSTIFDTGTNMQNLPDMMRVFLLADEGYVMYNQDLSQAENRTVAFVAPEPSMMQAFESGEDIHRKTAGLIFSKPISEVSDEPGSCPIGGGAFSERFWGKKANHGLNYDLSYKSFALLYEIPENEARFIVERYHQAYPGVRRWHAKIRNKLAKDRTLTNCMGRSRTFLDRWSDELFKEAYSFIPQSTVADKMNQDGLIFAYTDENISKDVCILLQVHDSLVIQVPLSLPWIRHAEIILRIKKSLESPIHYEGRSFSIPSDLEMGLNFGKHSQTNPSGLRKVKNVSTDPERLADQLSTIFGELRASR